jgi:hypothetical protein
MTGSWAPNLPEADRQTWKGRAAHYRDNAKAMRELIEQIMKTTASVG